MRDLVATAGGRLIGGGAVDIGRQRADLTVVCDPSPESPVMQEEIFGPVLPVVTVGSINDAVAHVNDEPRPLALYLFTSCRATARSVLRRTSSGAAVVNHLMYHLLVNDLPFGGVGASGMGAYHGRWSFDTFSHHRAVLRKPTWPDRSAAYPPYTAVKTRILRALFWQRREDIL
ncbi:aldehyde dehydrogenase family protein [Nocardioides marmoraquaticus]